MDTADFTRMGIGSPVHFVHKVHDVHCLRTSVRHNIFQHTDRTSALSIVSIPSTPRLCADRFKQRKIDTHVVVRYRYECIEQAVKPLRGRVGECAMRIPSRARRTRPLAFFGLLLFSLPVFAFVVPDEMLKIQMADGTLLATDYYLPKEGGPSWPVVLSRTTYPRSQGMRRAERYLKSGYAFVFQDVRGVGGSTGDRNIFFADGWRDGKQDGAETVAWIKRQPWCNGKIATVGESALGITQVLLAPATRDLACQIIVEAPSNFYHNLAYQGGVWKKNLADTWLSVLSLSESTPICKGHFCWDEFWTHYDAESKASDITAPAIHTGGWFDIFLQGTINNFMSRQYHGGPGAKGNQKLIMRFAVHNGKDDRDYTPKPNRRDLDIGQIERQFMDYWMKGEPNGIMDQPAVWYYTMGDDRDPHAPGNEWRTANDWPPFPTTDTSFYLAPGGALLPEPAAESARFDYEFNPLNPLRTDGGANLFMPAGPHDQRKTNRNRRDLLKFATPPLAAPIEATGRVFVKLFVSTDAPDTDFTAKLVDIFPPGDDREILILDGIQRLKFRHGFDSPAPPPASPEEVFEITVDLWSTSWIFNTGHRIGVQISSSNYPRYEVNPNNGDNFPGKSAMRTAHNAVHAGKAYPSALILPVRP